MAPTRAGIDRTTSRHGRPTIIPRMMKIASAVRIEPVEYGPVVASGSRELFGCLIWSRRCAHANAMMS